MILFQRRATIVILRGINAVQRPIGDAAEVWGHLGKGILCRSVLCGHSVQSTKLQKKGLLLGGEGLQALARHAWVAVLVA